MAVTRSRGKPAGGDAPEAAKPPTAAAQAAEPKLHPPGHVAGSPLASLDSTVSHAMYRGKTGTLLSTLYHIIAEVVTFSGDELLWLMVAVPGSFIFINRLWQRPSNPGGMSCAEEFCWDVFGACCACIFFETFFKCIFQRTRPWYGKQRTQWVVYGEVYSFPSGHTIRAVYLGSGYLAKLGAKFNMPLLSSAAAFPTVLTVWMFAVAWSRVALGKHYFGDTVAGALLGALLVQAELMAPTWVRSSVLMWGGIFVTVQWGKMYVIDQVLAGCSFQTKAIVGTLFYTFYSTLLIVVLREFVDLWDVADRCKDAAYF